MQTEIDHRKGGMFVTLEESCDRVNDTGAQFHGTNDMYLGVPEEQLESPRVEGCWIKA